MQNLHETQDEQDAREADDRDTARYEAELDKRDATISGLYELIDFLQYNHELPLPKTAFTLYYFTQKDEHLDLARRDARIYKTYEREQSEDYLRLTKSFGKYVTLQSVFSRDAVCTPRVVGTHKVMKDIYPEYIKPAQVEVEEDIVEWDCPSLLKEHNDDDPS